MRPRVPLTAALLALVASPLVATGHADPAPGGFMSPNVHWVANIPIDSPGVGARIVQVGKQTRFYVTGVKGLSIYDVTNPAIPLPLGTVPLPHWENEAVSVSADGSIAIVAIDLGIQTYVVDTSIPTAPRLASIIPDGTHTAACSDAKCSYLYASDGWTYDLRERTAPKKVTGWEDAVADQGVSLSQGAHNLNRDESGLIVTDTVPRLVLDPRRTPVRPKVLATGNTGDGLRLAYQHNNVRPNGKAWHPRKKGDNSAALRPGELLLAEGETNFSPSCGGGSGPFATWSMANFDRGQTMRPLHVFRPVNGDYADGNPEINAVGCSGHWFTYRKQIVAAGWYEHGTRFLKIDERTGGIKEVGYYQPIVGSTSAAHWVNDEYVYTVDYERGIDILRFDRAAKVPTAAAIQASWLAKLHSVAAPTTVAEQFVCRFTQRRTR